MLSELSNVRSEALSAVIKTAANNLATEYYIRGMVYKKLLTLCTLSQPFTDIFSLLHCEALVL